MTYSQQTINSTFNMIRIFRVDHNNELSTNDPHFEYIDVTKDINIKEKYINVRPVKKMTPSNLPLYFDNYIIWSKDALLMKSVHNDLELVVDETEVNKAIVGYYELRDTPVVVFYLNDEQLKFLKSRNKASNVKFERSTGPGAYCRWYLLPGEIEMGHSLALTYSLRLQRMEEGSRMFYFTKNDRLFCSTLGTRFCVIEVDEILDCPHSYYDIAEKVYKFDMKVDTILQSSRIRNEELSKYLGKPVKFLGETFMPE